MIGLFCKITLCAAFLVACNPNNLKAPNRTINLKSFQSLDNLEVKDKFIEPSSCSGIIGLDFMAVKAALGPRSIDSPQNRSDFNLSDDYLLGVMNETYGEARRLILNKNLNLEYTQSGFGEDFFRLFLPTTYYGMCQNDKDLMLLVGDIISTISENALQTLSTGKDERAYQHILFIKLIDWEIKLFNAVKYNDQNSQDELLRVFSDINDIARDREKNWESDKVLSFVSGKNISDTHNHGHLRLSLFYAKALKDIGFLRNDTILIDQSLSEFQYLLEYVQNLPGNRQKILSRSHQNALDFHEYYVSQLYLEYMDFISKSQKRGKITETFRAFLKIPKNNDQERIDKLFLSRHFDITLKKAESALLYEDSPFLWSLRHFKNFEFRYSILSQHLNKTIVTDKDQLQANLSAPEFCKAKKSFDWASKGLIFDKTKYDIKYWC